MIPNALLNEKKRRGGGRRREKGEWRNEKEKTFVLIHEFSSANRAVNAGQDFSVKFHQ